jgi:hypothetical protein
MAQQPPATDKYARLAGIYQKALSEANDSDDPEAYKTRARAAYDRAVTKVAEEAVQQPAALPGIAEEVRRPMGAAKAIGTALATGIPGVPAIASAVGAVLSRKQGESFGEAYQQQMKNVGEQEQQAKQELYPGMGTALQLAPMALASSKLPLLGARAYKDAPMLAKALAAGKRVAGAGALAGVESAGRQGMSENELSPGMAALFGAGIAGAIEGGPPLAKLGARLLPFGIGPAIQAGAKALAEPVKEVVSQGRRGITEGIRGYIPTIQQKLPDAARFAEQAAQFIEPFDVQRIQQEAARNLPGGAGSLGVTTASMSSGSAAARTAQQQAAIAAAEAKGKASLTASELRAARSKAGETMRQAKQQAGATQSLTEQRAEAVEAMGKSRAERLSEASKTAGAEAKAIQSGASAELKQAATATRKQAKLVAEEALEEARGEAAAVVGGMRGRQPRGAANKLQETVRSKQLREAEGHYEALRAVGAPPEPDPEVYKEIFADPALRSAYDGAVSTIKKEARNATPGAPAVTPTRTININGTAAPEITLETMDQMRRKILNPPYDPNKVGLTRSQKTQALETINRLEERYLAGFGTDEAAEAVRAARGPYREKFETLEAVRDGLNLGSVKAGKTSGILKQGTKELDEVVKRVEQMTPKQRTAFQVGAREWFDRALQESSDNALAIAKKFSTEASQRRLALAYGDEAVEALRAFAPDIVGKRQAAAAARVREEGAQLAQQITKRAEAAATPLQSRAERAADLAERANTEKAARAQQLVTQGKSAQEQAVLNARRLAETDVRTARQAAEAAQTDAQKMAQSLVQAKIASQQAKGLNYGDLERALGDSDAQQKFLQRLYPQMTPEQRQQSAAVLGSKVQNELQDMMRSNKPAEEIMARINLLRQNDAVRTLFGPQIDATVANLRQKQSLLIPLRSAVAGQAAGRINP